MQKLHVLKIEEEASRYIVSIEETVEHVQLLKAGERMLVDSDGLAFIYILEDDTKFYYLSFPKETWKTLKKSYAEKADLELICNEITIPLVNIHNELAFLLENIDGNGNYGEEMEKAVQEEFQQN